MAGASRVEEVKSFLVDFVERDDWLDERRRLLRQRAGLTNADTAKVPKFQFIIAEGRTIGCREVESDHNFALTLEYLANFAADLPSPTDVQAALAWASEYWMLNPWPPSKKHLHQGWAETEGAILRSVARYCMERFQRHRKSRSGHERMEQIREVIKAVLEEKGLLSPDGKKVPSRGPGAKRLKQEEAMRLFLVWDAESISETTDTIVEDLFTAIDKDDDEGHVKVDSKRKDKSKKKKRSSSDTEESKESDEGSDSSQSDSDSKKKKKKGKKNKKGKGKSKKSKAGGKKKETKEKKEKRMKKEQEKLQKEKDREEKKATNEIFNKGKKAMTQLNDKIVDACRREKSVQTLAPDLKTALSTHLVKKKNTLCDLRGKIQRKIDSFDEKGLLELVSETVKAVEDYTSFLTRSNMK